MGDKPARPQKGGSIFDLESPFYLFTIGFLDELAIVKGIIMGDEILQSSLSSLKRILMYDFWANCYWCSSKKRAKITMLKPLTFTFLLCNCSFLVHDCCVQKYAFVKESWSLQQFPLHFLISTTTFSCLSFAVGFSTGFRPGQQSVPVRDNSNLPILNTFKIIPIWSFPVFPICQKQKQKSLSK